jgi:hypothetical protein
VGARFSAPVHTGPGTHPASYARDTGSLSQTNHTHVLTFRFSTGLTLCTVLRFRLPKALSDIRTSYVPKRPAHVGNQYTYGQQYKALIN